MLGSVVTGGIVRRGFESENWVPIALYNTSHKPFLNPGAVDGIVRSVESRKQLLHPVVVDKVM